MQPPSATRVLLLLLAAAAGARAEDKPVPDFLMVCKKNNPNLNDCVQESIESLRPRLAAGIPELNVPSMEPLLLKEFTLSDSGTLRITGSDIQCFKTSQFVISNLRVDVDKGEIGFHLDFAALEVTGRYKVEGRILLIPVRGDGPVSLNITSPSADVDLRFVMTKRDGEEYIDFVSLEVKVVVPGGVIRLDNLFGGDKLLGDVVNAAVNLNFEQILRELNPSIQRALETNLLEIAREVGKSFPARQLIPDN